MQNSVRDGRSIDYTASKNILGGKLVVLEDMVAVASTDIAKDETGACEAVGVFELPKDNSVLAQGQQVYATADGVITGTGGADTVPAGKTWEAAPADAATVLMKINV